MKRLPGLHVWLLFATVSSGCGGMLTSDQPPDHVYWLEATSLQLGETSDGELPSLVVVVDTLPGLDTDRILVKGPGARLNHYAGARWPDHLPEVMAAAVRLSLESSGRFARVGDGTRIRGSEWSLELELREFFAVADTADTPPEIHVQLAGHMNCDPGETPFHAAAKARAEQNNLGSIVAAFQQATNDALVDLGRQLENACFPEEAASDIP